MARTTRTARAVIELASLVFCVAYLVCVLFCIERSTTQPVSPQMFHASGKREGGCLDGGRGGVLQEASSTRLQHNRVRCPHTSRLLIIIITSISLCLFYISYQQ